MSEPIVTPEVTPVTPDPNAPVTPVTPEVTPEGTPEEINLYEGIEFEEDMHYNLNELNLSPEQTEDLQPSLERLRNANVSQEHVELFFDIVRGGTDPEAIKQNLDKVLPYEIKRSYKALGGFAKDTIGLSGDDLNEAMSDPLALRIMNEAFKMSKSPRQTLRTPQRASAPAGLKLSDTQISEKAKHFFSKVGKTPEEQKAFVNELVGYAQNPEAVKTRYKSILNK